MAVRLGLCRIWLQIQKNRFSHKEAHIKTCVSLFSAQNTYCLHHLDNVQILEAVHLQIYMYVISILDMQFEPLCDKELGFASSETKIVRQKL